MKNIRKPKKKKGVQTLTVRQQEVGQRLQLDKNVFDAVMKVLFDNADKNALHLEREIYSKAKIKLSKMDAERLWDTLTTSGLVSPVMGFGNAGKVALTNTGMQIMSQYGGYKEYLEFIQQQNSNQPQTIILPIQVQDDGDATTETEVTIELPPAQPPAVPPPSQPGKE